MYIKVLNVQVIFNNRGELMVKIIVYSTDTCPYCDMAKEYLQQKGVEFEEINVGKDSVAAQKMVAKSGQMGVPQIEIDGNIIVGFDKAAIERELEKR